MKDHYQILGVPENAAANWIEREYQKRVAAINGDEKLKPDAKQKSLSAIEDSYNVLSNAAARQVFDAELAAFRDKKETSGSGAAFRKYTIPALIIAAVAVGGAFFWHQQEQKRVFLEEQARERAAEEKRAADRAAETRRREELAIKEAAERRKAEDERILQMQAQREEEMKTQQFKAGGPVVPRVKTAQELYDERRSRVEDAAVNSLRNLDAAIQRAEADRATQRAQQDVERQRRFVEQQRMEEERAAAARAAAARNATREGR
jgi:curved DNA-binding protein CbpA